MSRNRRDFLQITTLPIAGFCLSASTAAASDHVIGDESTCAEARVSRRAGDRSALRIGLSSESVLRAIDQQTLDLLDFPSFAIDMLGIRYFDLPSLVTTGLIDRHALENLRSRSEAVGARWLMITGGSLRLDFVPPYDLVSEITRYQQRIEQAEILGAEYLRLTVSVRGDDATYSFQAIVDHVRYLADQSAKRGVSIVLQPQANDRASRQWINKLIQAVAHFACASAPILDHSLPRQCDADRYDWLRTARVIIAKSKRLAEGGIELECDYPRFFQAAAQAGFQGHMAIDCDGVAPQTDGIRATAKLLQQMQRCYFSANHSERVANSTLLPAGSRT